MAKTTPVAPLFKALGDYKSILISIGCFTALINVLMLVPSIYMLQVYDRVLSSQNETTLVMLTLMVVGFFAFIGVLEVIRSFIVIRIGSQLERRFNLRVYKAAFERNLQRGEGHGGQSLGDLTHIRQFITGPALFAFFDAPWFPIYLFVIFLFNVWLGVLASAGAVLLIALACLNEYLTKKPLGEASGFSQQSTQLATSHLHNAETIQAMGMLGALRKRWFKVHSQFLGLLNKAIDTLLINDSRQLRDAVGERLRHTPVTGESNVWVKALGSWGKTDSRSDTAGYTTSLGGMLAAVDGAPGQQTPAGLGGGSSERSP